MPITVPDAIADLSMAICKSVYRIILGGLDEQVVMTSLIKGHVLSVLNMFQNSPFIREVITTCSSKPPSIILYTDLQMAMLKSQDK
jgi:hypothetical protein